MSEEYIEQYKELHHNSESYGKSSEKFYFFVEPLAKWLKASNIIDYGCGKSTLSDLLAKRLSISNSKYDPAINGIDKLPNEKFDFLINTDVLEHVPENEIPTLLHEMASLSRNAFFSISIVPAKTTLPNGENAHCTVRPPEWWQEKLKGYYSRVYEIPSNRPTNCFFITWKPSLILRAKIRLAKLKYKLKYGY